MIASQEVDVKIDSYVLETTVHFPTDANLLWDAARKCIDLTKQIIDGEAIVGWRKIKDWRNRIKSAFVKLTRTKKSKAKDNEHKVIEATQAYLTVAREFCVKLVDCDQIFRDICEKNSAKTEKYNQLVYYFECLNKQINLLERRVIFGEVIPQSEKVYSIFEPYTEWIQKGKAGNKVELGLRVAIATDQHHFILGYRVMEQEQDLDVAVPMVDNLLTKFSLNSASFDKGFWSKANFLNLVSKVTNLVMPKKGKCNNEESERESSKKFKALKKQHSAVESNINCLEHHGLNRCPDKGLQNFKKYIAVGVLTYNLHKLGNILLENDRNFAKAA